ncbi:hypothetical protein Psta_2476 [Pirellula staleyi DSM 6068]|uniref:Uncharacterized protein n=1 Tax=Pirellula staleyi (strain ATCC 27377 / DSM 6068 / ICPB 4128) TaxID=530564 RepID=D2R4S9_PIRSD|nr:hypothetical protein [Pirellula staleyi]ADB17145.1 hypothetical protein Psta_2476 [Pirellula staleyi DSM 6068]
MIGIGMIEMIILGLVCMMGLIVPIVIAVVLVAGKSSRDGRDEQK